jgi:hypothetical protein
VENDPGQFMCGGSDRFRSAEFGPHASIEIPEYKRRSNNRPRSAA